MKVMIAEDDTHIRNGLRELLENEGYATVTAANGRDAWTMFEREAPDFVLLDIMMPERDGYDICREIRKANPTVPVIFISAKSEEIDRVVGLELGADDFIVKPFGTREVVARIRAVTRRCLSDRTANENTVLHFGDLEVYPAELRARRGGAQIDLSLRDVRLLELLYRHRGKVVDRDAIFNHCWGRDYLPSSRTLDQQVSKLRKQIERDPKNPTIIRTVHGVGYRYDDESEA